MSTIDYKTVPWESTNDLKPSYRILNSFNPDKRIYSIEIELKKLLDFSIILKVVTRGIPNSFRILRKTFEWPLY